MNDMSKDKNIDIQIYNFDLSDKELLRNLFKTCDIRNVIHLAGFKSVGESINDPLTYYSNNVTNTITWKLSNFSFGIFIRKINSRRTS